MHEHPIVKKFMELAAIDAVSLAERDLADRLTQELLELGCEVVEDDTGSKIGGNAGNLLARLPGSLPGHILFCAHMDRVEPGNGIKPQIKDGVIYTDGTTVLAGDDLTGIVAVLQAIKAVKQSGREHATVEVVFTVCEERRLAGSQNLDYRQLKSQIGYVLDTSGPVGRIVNRAPYKGTATIEVFGKAAHAGNYPERGLNAIMAAAHILHDLQEGRLDKYATSNFGSICGGGENIGTVCDYVKIRGELRNINQAELYEYYDYVQAHCVSRSQEIHASCQVDFVLDYEGFEVGETEPTMQFLTDTLVSMGIRPQIETGMGGMDANNFNAHGIRSVGVAMGYRDPHSLQETIVIEDLVRAGELVEQLVFNYRE